MRLNGGVRGVLLLIVVGMAGAGLAFPDGNDAFMIGAWCGPPKGSTNDRSFSELAAAGFTVVFPPCDGGRTYAENLKILRLSHENGLRALIIGGPRFATPLGSPDFLTNVRAEADRYSGKAGLYGYFIADEPSARDFARLGALTAALRMVDPAHPAYVNLFPNYANSAQLGLPSYRDYLEAYVNRVHPRLISYDHYSQMRNLDPSQFFENLAQVRARALASGTPFIDTILVTAHGPYRSPTRGELAWQVYASLAYGSRGILYFTYWTPPGSNWRDAMIDANGERTRHYYEVQRLNEKIRVLGETLVGLHSTGVYFSNPAPWYGPRLPSTWLVRGVGGPRVLIGSFEDEVGRTYLFFVNRNPLHGGECSVSLAAGVTSLTRINDSAQDHRLTLVPQGGGHSVQFYLEAGQGLLFRVD